MAADSRRTMNAQPQPTAPTPQSVCGIILALVAWATMLLAAIGGMVIGYRTTQTAGWIWFAQFGFAAFAMFGLSTGLHFLARITAAVERQAPAAPAEQPEAPTGSAESWMNRQG